MKVAVLLAHHNIPLAVMDHLSPLLRDLFPDSKIAKGFSAARTKTTCIVNLALRPHLENALVAQMKSQPFALAVDGSNDNGLCIGLGMDNTSVNMGKHNSIKSKRIYYGLPMPHRS